MEGGVGRCLDPGEQNQPSETVDYRVKSGNMEVASIVALEIVHSSFEGGAGVGAGESFFGSPSIANVPDEETNTKQETCQAAAKSYQAEKTMLDKEQIEKENPASVVQEINDSQKDDQGKKSEKDAELKTSNEAVVLGGSTGQDEGPLNLNPDLTGHSLDTSVDTCTQPTLKNEAQMMESNGEKISRLEGEQADSCSRYLDEEKTPDVAKPIENIESENEDNKNDSIREVPSIMATSLEIQSNNEESSAITEDGKDEPDNPSATLETDRSSMKVAQPEVRDKLEKTSYVESTEQNQGTKDSIASLDENQDKCHVVNPSIIQTKDLCLQEVDKAETYEAVSETLLDDVTKSGSQESTTEALKTKPEADSCGYEKVKGETANEGKLDSLFTKHEDGEKNKVEEAALCEASAEENRDKNKDTVIESENNIRDALITPEYNQDESGNEVKTSLEMVSVEIDTADAMTCTKEDILIKNQEESFDKGKEEKPIDIVDDGNDEIKKLENLPPTKLNKHTEIAKVEIQNKLSSELEKTRSLEQERILAEGKEEWQNSEFEPLDQVHEANGAKNEEKHHETDTQAFEITENTILDLTSAKEALTRPSSERCEAEIEKSEKIQESDSEMQSEIKNAELSIKEDVQNNEEACEMYKLEITGDDAAKCQTEESSSEKINSTGFLHETIDQKFQAASPHEAAIALKDEEDSEKTKSTTNEEVSGISKITDGEQIRDNVTNLSSEVIDKETVEGYQQIDKQVDNSNGDDTREQIMEGNSAASISQESVEKSPVKKFQNDEKNTGSSSSRENLKESETAETIDSITNEAKHRDEIPSSTFQCSLVQVQEIVQSENTTVSEESSVAKIALEKSSTENDEDEKIHSGLPLAEIGEQKETVKGGEDVEEKMQKNECQEYIEHPLNIISGETMAGTLSQLEENTVEERVESQKMESETEKEENITNGSNIKSLPQESVAEDPVNFQNDDGCTDKSNAMILEESKAAGTCESFENETYQNVECPIETPALLVDTTVSSESIKIIRCAKDDTTIEIHEESPDKKDREEASVDIGDIRNELPKEKNPLPRELNEKIEIAERETPDNNVDELNLTQSAEEKLGEVPDFEPEDQVHEANANREDVKNDENQSEVKDAETSKKEDVQKKEEAGETEIHKLEITGGDTTKYHTEESSSEKINSTDLLSETIEQNFQAAKALKDEEDNEKTKSTTNEEITGISKDTDDAQMRDNVTNLSSEVINQGRVEDYQQTDKEADNSQGKDTKEHITEGNSARCISLEAVEDIPDKNFKNDEKNAENSSGEILVEFVSPETVGIITHEAKHSDEIPNSTLQCSLVQEYKIAHGENATISEDSSVEEINVESYIKNGGEENQLGLPLAKIGEPKKEILKGDKDVEEKMQKNECQENIEHQLNVISAETESGTLSQLEENTIQEKVESVQDNKMESETEKEENITNGSNIKSLPQESVAEDPFNFQNDDGCTDKSNAVILEESKAAGTCESFENETYQNVECPIETPALLVDTTVSSEGFKIIRCAKDDTTIEIHEESPDKKDREEASVDIGDIRNELPKEKNPLPRELNEKIEIAEGETPDNNVDELNLTQSAEEKLGEVPDFEPEDQVHEANANREDVKNDENQSEVKDAETSKKEDVQKKEEAGETQMHKLEITGGDTTKYHTEESSSEKINSTDLLSETIEQNFQAAMALKDEEDNEKTKSTANEEITGISKDTDDAQMRDNVTNLSSEVINQGRVEGYQQTDKEADNSQGKDTKEHITEGNSARCISLKAVEDIPDKNFKNDEKNAENSSGEILVEFVSPETVGIITHEAKHSDEIPNSTLHCSLVQEYEIAHGENATISEGSSVEKINVESYIKNGGEENQLGLPLAKIGEPKKEILKGDKDVEEKMQKNECQENIEHQLNVISAETESGTLSQLEENTIQEKVESVQDNKMESETEKEENITNGSNIKSLPQESVAEDPFNFQNDDGCTDKSNAVILEESKAAGTCESFENETYQNVECPIETPALLVDTTVSSEGFKIIRCAKDDTTIEIHEESPDKKNREEASVDIGDIRNELPKEKNPLPRELNEKIEIAEGETPDNNVDELNLTQSAEEKLGEVPDFEPEDQVHEANANREDVKKDENQSEVKDAETSKKEDVQTKEEAGETEMHKLEITGGDTTKYHTEESSSEKINSTDLLSETIEQNFQAAKALKDEEDNEKTKSTANEEITGISKDTDDAQIRDNVTNLSSEVINQGRVEGYQQTDKEADNSQGKDTKEHITDGNSNRCISLEAVADIPDKNFKNDEKNAENSSGENLVGSETAETVGSITHETKHRDEIPNSTLQSSLVQEQETAQSKNGEEEENQSGLPLAKVGELKEILKDEDVEEKMQKNECQENIEYQLNVISAETEAVTLSQLEENTIEEKVESVQDGKMESETEKEKNIINGRNINSLPQESVAEDPVNFQNDDGCSDKSNTMTLEKSKAAGTCKIDGNKISQNAKCPIETIPSSLADTAVSSECFETLKRDKDKSTIENQESFDKKDKEKTSVDDDFRNEIPKEKNPQRELNEKIEIAKVETLGKNVDELNVTQSAEPEVGEIPDLEPEDQVRAANVAGREEVNNDETESQACQSTNNTELELPCAKGEAILDTSETENEKLEKVYELESKEILENKDAEMSIVEDTENKEETCEKDAQDLATSDDTRKYHTEEVFNTASLHKTIEQNSQAGSLHEATTTLEAEGKSRKTVDVINEEIMDISEVADEENLKDNFIQLSSEKEAAGSSRQPEKEADKGENTEEQIIDQNNVTCISQKSDEEELVENFQNYEKNGGKPSSVETFDSSEVAETAEQKNTKEHGSSQGENLTTCDGSSAEEIDIDGSSIRKDLDKESYTDLAEVANQSRDSSKREEDAEQLLQKDEPSENIDQPLNVISVEITVETSSQMGDNIIEEKFDSPQDNRRDEGIEEEKDIPSERNITSLLQDSVEQNQVKSFKNDDNSAEKSNTESLEESEAAGTSEHIMHEANQNNETPVAAIALSLAKEVESLQCEDEGVPAEASPEEKKKEGSSFQINQSADSITMLEDDKKEIDKETLKTIYQFAHEMNQKEESPDSSSQASMVKEDAERILQKDEPKENIELQHKTVEETIERLKYNEKDEETAKGEDIIKECNIRSHSLESVADDPVKNFENDGASAENSNTEIPEQSEAAGTGENTTDEANENDSLSKTTPASLAEDVQSLLCEDKDIPEEASPEKKKEESSFKIDEDIEKITMAEEDNKDRDQETSKTVSAHEIMNHHEESLNSSTEASLIREQQTPEGDNLILPVALTIDEQEENDSSIKMDEGKDNNVLSAGTEVGVLCEVANNPKEDIGKSSQDHVNETKMPEEEDSSKEHIVDDCNNKSPSEEPIEERTDKITQNDENNAEMSNKEIFEEFATGESIAPVKEEESLQSEGNDANLAEALSEEKKEDDRSPIKASEVNESNAELAEAIKIVEKEISHGEEIIEPKLQNESEEFVELSGDVINEESKAGMLNDKADDINIPGEVEAIQNSEQTGEKETKGNEDTDGSKDTNALASENLKLAGKMCDDNIIVEEKSVTNEMEFETVKTDGLNSVEKLAKATSENTEEEVLKRSVSINMAEKAILDQADFVKKSEASIKENDAAEKATPEHESGKQNQEVDISETKNYEIPMEENLKLAESSMKLDHTSEIVTSDQSNETIPEISPNKLEEKEISESLEQRSEEYLETQQETEEKKYLEVEDEYQIKETQNSKDIKDAILPDEVDKEVEKTEGNDTVEHFNKDKNDISEVYTVSIGDERVNEVKEGSSAITEHLEVTDSNEKTETANLEVQEAQNFRKETTVTNEKEKTREEGDTREKDVGLLTAAPTKETTEVIKEENIDNTDSACNKIKATTVMEVTAEHSLEEVQTDEKPMQVSNMPPDASNVHAAEADASQQESMALEENIKGKEFLKDESKTSEEVCLQKEEFRELQFSKLDLERNEDTKESQKEAEKEASGTSVEIEDKKEASLSISDSNLKGNRAAKEEEIYPVQTNPMEKSKEQDQMPSYALLLKEQEDETSALIGSAEEKTKEIEEPKLESKAIEEANLQKEESKELKVFSFESQLDKDAQESLKKIHQREHGPTDHEKEETKEVPELEFKSSSQDYTAVSEDKITSNQPQPTEMLEEQNQTSSAGLHFEEKEHVISTRALESKEEKTTGVEVREIAPKTIEEEPREFMKLELQLHDDMQKESLQVVHEAEDGPAEEPLKLQPQHEIKKGDAAKTDLTTIENQGEKATEATEKMLTEVPNEQIMEEKNEAETPSAITLGEEATKESHQEHQLIDEEKIGAKRLEKETQNEVLPEEIAKADESETPEKHISPEKGTAESLHQAFGENETVKAHFPDETGETNIKEERELNNENECAEGISSDGNMGFTSAKEKELSVETYQKEGAAGLPEATEIVRDIHQQQKTSKSTLEDQIFKQTEPETVPSTGKKEVPEVLQEPNVETTGFTEVRDLQPVHTTDADSEVQRFEYGTKHVVDCKNVEANQAIEETVSNDSANISLYDMEQQSRREKQATTQLSEESELMASKEEVKAQKQTGEREMVKSDEEAEEEVEEEEEEGEERKKNDSGSDAPVMVEASRDIEIKVVHKKSHNILSGVGSKVKHSIIKVKKAITGKSSHPKHQLPK